MPFLNQCLDLCPAPEAVQVTGDTRFFEWTLDGRLPAAFGDVTVGDSANVKGTMIDGELVALQVTVDVALSCTQ